jgi:monofunctional chorismate mutase
MSRFEIAAVRGAVPVRRNTAGEILSATARLLTTLLAVNRIGPSSVVSALFTTTEDLDAEFPAHAARKLGWTDVPMLHAREIPVPGSMPRVVRVLLTVRGVPKGVRLVPVYLDAAAKLRPDLGAAAPSAHRSVARRAERGRRRAGAPSRRAARRIALIGIGQIGGSLGLSLGGNPRWHRVGWDANARVMARALREGAIDESCSSLAAACRGADVAVIATPVDTIPDLIDRAARALPARAVLLDTGSARAGATAALSRARRIGIRAAGFHPIAGNEGRGFASARAGLFAGATIALLPARGSIPPLVRSLVRDLGARARVVTPARHDRALARTSHLPYLLARALAERGSKFAKDGLSGPGYWDMTRLARSDPRIAQAYAFANAREVRAAWRDLQRSMERGLASLRKLSRV